MRILCVNDDGIHAPGLSVLERIAHSLSDDVWVVAPETEQSGASRSLTLNQPVRVRQETQRRFAVSGTPTDCVLLAVQDLVTGGRPDLVLSGVNRGQNLAEDVTFSGTIAGAMQGMQLGIPAIALSQTRGAHANGAISWAVAEQFGPDLMRRLLEVGWSDGVVLNVNFPDCAPDDVRGVEITRQGHRDQRVIYADKRTDLRGQHYYWLGFRGVASTAPDGSDLNAIYSNAISVTPLHVDLTEASQIERLAAKFTKP